MMRKNDAAGKGAAAAASAVTAAMGAAMGGVTGETGTSELDVSSKDILVKNVGLGGDGEA